MLATSSKNQMEQNLWRMNGTWPMTRLKITSKLITDPSSWPTGRKTERTCTTNWLTRRRRLSRKMVRSRKRCTSSPLAECSTHSWSRPSTGLPTSTQGTSTSVQSAENVNSSASTARTTTWSSGAQTWPRRSASRSCKALKARTTWPQWSNTKISTVLAEATFQWWSTSSKEFWSCSQRRSPKTRSSTWSSLTTLNMKTSTCVTVILQIRL